MAGSRLDFLRRTMKKAMSAAQATAITTANEMPTTPPVDTACMHVRSGQHSWRSMRLGRYAVRRAPPGRPASTTHGLPRGLRSTNEAPRVAGEA